MTANALFPNDDYEVLCQKLRAVLGLLTSEEQAILTFRFGLKEDGAHSLAETMQQFGVTRERIRQIEAKALRKARPLG